MRWYGALFFSSVRSVIDARGLGGAIVDWTQPRKELAGSHLETSDKRKLFTRVVARTIIDRRGSQRHPPALPRLVHCVRSGSLRTKLRFA